ncbi:hypothetical protein [Longilinea arvoryzae]|uniref:hypothetical protein n=1 Tax=Longilinea arvoryzae TaxID=360412 RepID=UPI0012600EC5|nr:hypothetical protein [Longilinea arvoryzae]
MIDETGESKVQLDELDKVWAVEDVAAYFCITGYKVPKIAASHCFPATKIGVPNRFLKSKNPLFMTTYSNKKR